MKRLMFCLLLLVLCSPVLATQLTFQKPSDFSEVVVRYNAGNTNPGISWVANGTGGNSYASISTGGVWKWAAMTLPSTSSSSYAAATLIGGTGYPGIMLLASDGTTQLWYATLDSVTTTDYGPWVVTVIGGTGSLYVNGTLRRQMNLAVNPSYIGFGDIGSSGTNATGVCYAGGFQCGAYDGNPHYVYWDDYIYGSTETREILGIPNPDQYQIVKDFITGAGSGLNYIGNGSSAQSIALPVSFCRDGNYSNVADASKLIYLKNELETRVYQNISTGTNHCGYPNFNLTAFFASDAPFGVYTIELEDSDAIADKIFYLGSGATITFDRDTYSQGDTATISYNVFDDYWRPSTYEYSIRVYDGTTYEIKSSTIVTLQTSTTSYTFTTSDNPGTYYAVINARNKVSDDNVWMAVDWADVDAFVTFYGYVMAETGAVISGANVSVTQGDIYTNTITPSDGSYTATGLYAGATTRFNVTATGYTPENVYLIPLSAGSIQRNITLNSTSPSILGNAIGGVARDGVFDVSTRMITKGYGRPIPDATIYVFNTGTAEMLTRTTNIAGWYLCGESESCFLSKALYDVWGQKTGYNNSQNYSVVVS